MISFWDIAIAIVASNSPTYSGSDIYKIKSSKTNGSYFYMAKNI